MFSWKSTFCIKSIISTGPTTGCSGKAHLTDLAFIAPTRQRWAVRCNCWRASTPICSMVGRIFAISRCRLPPEAGDFRHLPCAATGYPRPAAIGWNNCRMSSSIPRSLITPRHHQSCRLSRDPLSQLLQQLAFRRGQMVAPSAFGAGRPVVGLRTSSTISAMCTALDHLAHPPAQP